MTGNLSARCMALHGTIRRQGVGLFATEAGNWPDKLGVQADSVLAVEREVLHHRFGA